jgi:hypothetical protein
MHNVMMQRSTWALSPLAFALCAASCGFPSFDFRATEAPLDGAVDAVADAPPAKPSCVGGTLGDACARIPALAGAQKVDGVGDELCSAPVTRFDKTTAKFNLPDPPPSDVDPHVEVRTAWSTVGLHLHVHVQDARVIVVPPESNILHYGDSIEVYTAGFVPTAGDYDDKTDVGAVHVIVAPPGTGIGARAYLYTSRYDHIPVSLSPANYAGRIVDDGFEIELLFPWSLITRGAAPKAGDVIAFDLSVNAKDDPAQEKRSLQATLGYRSVAVPADSCSGVAPAQPYCDDRTWCLPTLE